MLVGYGRVGQRIADACSQNAESAYVVAEQNRELVEKLRARNIPAVCGDAADPAVLIQAHIARAGMLVIATPDAFDVRKMVEIARTLNPASSRAAHAQRGRSRPAAARARPARCSWANTNWRAAWRNMS